MQNTTMRGARQSARAMKEKRPHHQDVSASHKARTVFGRRDVPHRISLQNAKTMGSRHDLERSTVGTNLVKMNTQRNKRGESRMRRLEVFNPVPHRPRHDASRLDGHEAIL